MVLKEIFSSHLSHPEKRTEAIPKVWQKKVIFGRHSGWLLLDSLSGRRGKTQSDLQDSVNVVYLYKADF